MTVTFIHSADWQLGKPYGSVNEIDKRSILQQEQIIVVDRIEALVREHNARFVVLAGDTFDSPSPSKSTVSAGCAAIGRLKVPVFLIPGNHDHGGPLGLWEQPFFTKEREALAPNLRILLTPEPVEIDDAVLFPCPLLRRHEPTDLTAWLRPDGLNLDQFGTKPRIVIAHGSVQGFGLDSDDEDGGGAPNQIDLTRLEPSAYDYIALGDWHGTKQITPKAWYAGTPELDRFPKGADYGGGHTLVVTASRGTAPTVAMARTARIGWHALEHTFLSDADFDALDKQVDALVSNRVGCDLLRLELHGSLGLETTDQLRQRQESWESRLLRVKVTNRVRIAATDDELQALTMRVQDPIIARVAARLAASLSDPESEPVARMALHELHAATR